MSRSPKREVQHGEQLLVPERMVVSPTAGVFRPTGDLPAHVETGHVLGVVEGPATSTPVRSPFRGKIAGLLAYPGERLREGQPVAWLRVA
jgi:biotin carboxyl carrier protein